MTFKRKIKRGIPLSVLIIFLVTLVIVGICSPNFADRYSNLFLVAITAVYAYFTFSLLKATRLTKAFPHLSLTLVSVSSFKSDLYKRYETSIEQSEEFLRAKQADDEGGNSDRNYIFINAENTGESLAIAPKIDITFKRKTAIEGENDGHKIFNLSDLKVGEKITKLLCVFDHASKNDFIQIKSADLSYGDIGGYKDDETPSRYDMLESMGRFQDENVQIILKY